MIEIKETSRHAFIFLLNYIYGVSLELTDDLGALKLFEILNLAERYDMEQLKAEVTERLEQLRMREEDVVGVARVAEAFSHFEAVSGAVLASCSRLLKDVIVSDSVREEFCHTRSPAWVFILYKSLLSLAFFIFVRLLPDPVCC